MDLKNFTSAIAQIAEEKGIPFEKVIETIEMAIAAAYKKDYGKKGQIIKAKLTPDTGELKFWQVKFIVDQDMLFTEEELEAMKERKFDEEAATIKTESGVEKVRFNEERHMMIDEAKKIKKDVKVGEELEIPLETQQDYGRIAAQTAKQVILQRIREAERETVMTEFKSKEGEIISGIVQRIEGRNVFMDVNRSVGILTKEEQIPGEFYRMGQRLKVYLLKVEDSPKGPIIFLSRAYPKIISKLFELEVPEITQGQVVIKSIAREEGSRAKIAVASTVENIDPIGSMVGQKGTRVSAVINELGGEKIDIIAWDEDPTKYIANALSPAKVLDVKEEEKNKAVVFVPEDQLSLAIGKDGQNVRLAAKLTGWKIDVRPPQENTGAEEAKEEPAENKEAEKVKEEKKEKEVKVKKPRKTKKKAEEKEESKKEEN